MRLQHDFALRIYVIHTIEQTRPAPPDELYPRVGFIITNLSSPPNELSPFTISVARQSAKRLRTRPSGRGCHAVSSATRRFGLNYMPWACTFANFMRTVALPEEVGHWSLTTLLEKLVRDRRQNRLPWPLTPFPTGRGYRSKEPVSDNSGFDQ